MRWFNDLEQDVRLAIRMLGRSPAFAGAAIVTLGCGIGLAVAMFTISDTVLRRPLPVVDQHRVVVLWGRGDASARMLPLTSEHFERYREEARTLHEVAGALSAVSWAHAVRDGEQALSMNLSAVTGNFFRVLGSPPVLGRTLLGEDDVVGAPPVMVISHGLWRRHFASRPDVVGHRLTLHARRVTYTVVGVAAPGLEFPAHTDVWVPLIPFASVPEVVPIGRLAPGATAALAADELRASFAREPSDHRRRLEADASPLPDLVFGNLRPALLLLAAAAALLLLIGCVNVANLLLVRASARSHEIAIRRALGAAGGRILRQLLVESALLAVAAGLLGMAVAGAVMQGLLALAPPELPRLDEIRLAGVSLAMAAAVTSAAVLVFGVIPSFWSVRHMASPLRAGTLASSERQGSRRAQHALAVFQIAILTVLLVAAGLLGRTLRHLEQLDLGFAAGQVLIAQLTWPHDKFADPDAGRAFFDRLTAGLEALPDIASAAPVNVQPFTGAAGGWDGWFVPEGDHVSEATTGPVFNMAVVGSGFFRTLGVPLLAGRGFTAWDRTGSARVAVVSEVVAGRFWPGQDAVGKRIGLGRPTTPDEWWTVVGVAPETHYRALGQPAPTVYLPFRQFTAAAAVNVLAVRTKGGSASAVASLRRTVQETDADVVVMRVEPMEQLLRAELSRPRLTAVLLGVFGAGALLLAAVGLYAMLAYVVRRRHRELAIRLALGAAPERLRKVVLEQGLALAGTGILLGLAVSFAGAQVIRSLLAGVSPADPMTLAGVTGMVLAVALAASYVPARRAMRADPALLLRDE